MRARARARVMAVTIKCLFGLVAEGSPLESLRGASVERYKLVLVEDAEWFWSGRIVVACQVVEEEAGVVGRDGFRGGEALVVSGTLRLGIF